MTHSLNILTSLVLLTGAMAQEKPSEDLSHDESRKGAPRPDEFLKAYDSNQDRLVSKDEFRAGERAARLTPKNSGRIFSRLDKNADGFISIKELKKMAPKKRRRPLAKADLNKDGRISKREFQEHVPFSKIPKERREKMFTRLDHNSDGFLDRKDGRPRWRGGENLSRLRVKGLDLDGNGSLSWREFRSAPAVVTLSQEEIRATFKKLDADKNGEISAKEARAHPGGRPDKRSRAKK